MSSDTETHRALLSALEQARGKGDGAFEQAVTAAFEHVFAHLSRRDDPVPPGGPDGDDRPLRPGESPSLR